MGPSQHDARSSVDNVPTASGVAGQHLAPPQDPHGSPGRNVPIDEDNASVRTVIYDGTPQAPHEAAPASNPSDSSDDDDASSTKSEKPVTWRSLPKKGQLAILTFARLSEPLTQTSLQAYLFYQLKSFDPSLPDSTISAQAGLLQGTFTAAQFVTAVWWGRLADAEWMGRKRVLLISLLGTCISTLGYGFSRSFVTAAIFRTLGGILNSNIGVMRTMIAEIVEEKRYVGIGAG